MSKAWKNRNSLADLAAFAYSMFEPPALMNVSEWADKYRVLVSESSATPGPWRTDKAPYQREIMNAFTQPGVWQIVVMAGAQVGKTEIALNMMGRAIDLDPGPMLFVQPSDTFAEDFSKRRVAPMIRVSPALRNKVYEAKSRDTSNTITMKTFPGGSVAFTGANSPTDLAGRPIRYAFLDEIDRYPASAGTEGDPVSLTEKRTITFLGNRKVVKTSTPTIKGVSKIEKAYTAGTQEEWHTQCPHCGAFSFIRLQNIKYDSEKYEDEEGNPHYRISHVRWICPTCAAGTSEREAKRCPAKWVSKNPEALQRGIRSFRLNAFMSPFYSWHDICEEFMEKKDDPERLEVFVNTILGETWEVREHNTQPENLFARRETYAAEIPDGVLVLTMGIDTQDNRLEYEVVGWDRNEQSWGISRGIIPGRADDEATWDEVDGLMERVWTRKDGAGLRVMAAFIDSGGHFTEDVYRECAKRNTAGKKIWAVKGEGGEGKPLVRQMKRDGGDRSIKFIVGVDAGKEAIMYATTVPEPGPRYMHFPTGTRCGYDLEFFRGLCSEKMVIHRKQGQNVIAWEKIRDRNEPLDCRNYARAAYRFFHWDFDRYERRLRGEDEPQVLMTKAEHNRSRRNPVVSRGVQV